MPGKLVVTEPTAIVAAAPAAPLAPSAPVGIVILNTASLLVPAFVTDAFDPTDPVVTDPTAMVAP